MGAANSGGGSNSAVCSAATQAQAGNYGHPYYRASFIQSGAWSGIENKKADARKRQ